MLRGILSFFGKNNTMEKNIGIDVDIEKLNMSEQTTEIKSTETLLLKYDTQACRLSVEKVQNVFTVKFTHLDGTPMSIVFKKKSVTKWWIAMIISSFASFGWSLYVFMGAI